MARAVRFTEEGRSTLRQLHIEAQRTIKQALKQLGGGLRKGKALSGRLSGFHSLREGKYRAVYSIEENTILVHVVGHRRTVYDSVA